MSSLSAVACCRKIILKACALMIFGGVLNWSRDFWRVWSNVLAMEAVAQPSPMDLDENEDETENENASCQGNNEDEEVASELVN